MGFAKRRRKKVKPALLLVLLLVLTVALGGGIYYFINERLSEIELSYTAEIDMLKMEQYLNKQTVYMPLNNIQCGTIISEELLVEQEILTDLSNEIYFTKDDFGSFAKVDLEQNIPIMKNMISNEVLGNDIRLHEFTIFELPSTLKLDQFVDVRINFSNGEDFVVLSKKKVRNLNKETATVWFWLSEKELLQISSAVVDAYLHEGTRLYTTVYVEPSMQEAAVTTYPANVSVLQLMEENPNIIEEAEVYMMAASRYGLEDRLAGVLVHIEEANEETEEMNEDENNEVDMADTNQSEQEVESNNDVIETSSVESDEIIMAEVDEEGVISDETFFD